MGLSLSGVSFANGATYGGAVRSSAALRAQLAQYRKQLSDCVNCASSSTREGQNQIQQLTSRIATLEAQIAQATSAQATSTQASSRQPAVQTVTNQVVAGQSAPGPGAGRLLDVYA